MNLHDVYRPKIILLLLSSASVALPCFFQGLSAQETELHPRGLFETPQEGLNAPLPRTARDSDSWKDRFHLSIGASIRSDSNLYLNNNNQGEESDLVFSISPTLSYVLGERGSGLGNVSIAYTPSYNMYMENSDRNDLNHSFRLNMNTAPTIRFPKTTIGFNLGYNQSQGSNRFSGGLVESESLRTGVNVSHLLTGKTRLAFGARANVNNFDSGSLADDITYHFDASLMYQATGKISIGPYVNYGISRLDGSSGGLEHTQDHHSYGAGVSVNYEMSGKTSFTGRMGWSSYNFSGPDVGGPSRSRSGDDTLTWRMGVNHRISPKVSLRASLWRNYKPSNNIVNTGYVATGVSLSTSYRASDRWSHNATFTYENDDYFSDDPAGGTLDNDYYRISLGSRYRFNSGLNIGGDISSSSQNSSESANDFSNWVFGLNARYTFF